MLGSNQRPLPCESRSVISQLFASVQKSLQISILSLVSYRRRPPLFAWVGVLIGVFKLTMGAELPRALSSVAEDYSP